MKVFKGKYIYLLVVVVFVVSDKKIYPQVATDLETKLERAVILISHTKPGIQYAQGTGFIISQGGLAVTADHVIFDEDSSRVWPSLYAQRLTNDGFDYYDVKIVKRFRKDEKGRDIAVLQLEAKEKTIFPYFDIASKPGSLTGEIFIIGFPLVFDKVYPFPLVRRGIISSKRYSYEGGSILVLDLGSVNGFSGSPIVDKISGKVLGVMKGPPKKRPQTDFSVGFVLQQMDIAELETSLKKKTLRQN